MSDPQFGTKLKYAQQLYLRHCGSLAKWQVLQPRLLTEEYWTDMGAMAYRWKYPEPPNTCFVNDSPGARRDFVFLNTEAVLSLAEFHVSDADTFPTHKPVRAGMLANQPTPTITTPGKPVSRNSFFICF